jgi:hypothetical protein
LFGRGIVSVSLGLDTLFGPQHELPNWLLQGNCFVRKNPLVLPYVFTVGFCQAFIERPFSDAVTIWDLRFRVSDSEMKSPAKSAIRNPISEIECPRLERFSRLFKPSF